MPSKPSAGGGSAPAPAAVAAPVFALRATAKLPPDAETKFLASQWVSDLGSIPNLGPATEKALKAVGIMNTYNLCGQFLMLRSDGDTTQTRCNAFCSFLLEAGVSKTLLSVLTYAVAKKLNRSFPGFFVDSECVTLEGEEEE